MMQKSIILVCILASMYCNSQTLETVYKMKSDYQKCLNKGQNMRNCALEYYNQSDSLLNVSYKNLKSKISSKEQSKLKKEQLEWLKKRDQFFQKVYSDTKKQGNFIEGTQDFEMIIYDEQAKFVFGRVKELINKG
ncbi:lysozyme inhibitor LprI family protein [Flavobacterium sp. KACC 22758]|uniref:lysozyme inhibitor LprI family protein n=1 Tax=Flavobacterium sp. KACC 22758 TaxID=3025667 RepID=UPI002365A560|nr:lysozyme inhibitor LprI family protein [Flavobacterium sp. KACC 22758]WDF61505.1 lysozyme inhibitor LprI family protein [Flavobacterium sp. KACC 22758]